MYFCSALGLVLLSVYSVYNLIRMLPVTIRTDGRAGERASGLRNDWRLV